jgi:hypothetical protein
MLKLQEMTIRKLITKSSIIYIIPEINHFKECRLDDLNTFLFFSPNNLEWKNSLRSPLLPSILSAAVDPSCKPYVSERRAPVGSMPYVAPSATVNTCTEADHWTRFPTLASKSPIA